MLNNIQYKHNAVRALDRVGGLVIRGKRNIYNVR